MVALASCPPRAATASAARSGRFWAAAGLGVLVPGAALRLAIGGIGIGDRSAVVMLALVAAAVWAAVVVVGGPRAAFAAVCIVVGLTDLAGLAARNPAPYDDLQAVYRTDQVLAAQLPVASASDANVLTVLAQPIFEGAAPRFGLAGEINGAPLVWTCSFQPGIRQIALPLPADLLRTSAAADVRLHLTGSPAHDGDYLLAYMSSRQGGLVMAISSTGSVDPGATRCTLA